MGSCASSSNQQLIDEINKPENRKFLIEHLNLNKNDFISKSEITNNNNNNNNNNITNTKNLVESLCSKCKCSCHLDRLPCESLNSTIKHSNCTNNDSNYNELIFKIVSIDNANEENCQLKKISFLLNSSKHEIYVSKSNNDQVSNEIPLQENKQSLIIDANKDNKANSTITNENKKENFPKKQLKNTNNFKTFSAVKTSHENEKKLNNELSYFYSQHKQFYDYLNLNLKEERKTIDKCEKCLKLKKNADLNEDLINSKTNVNSYRSHKHRNRYLSSRTTNDLLNLYGEHIHQHHNQHTRSYNEFYQEFEPENLDDYSDLKLNILGKRSRSKKISPSPLPPNYELKFENSKCSTLNCQLSSRSPNTSHSNVNILKNASSYENLNGEQLRQVKHKKHRHHQRHNSNNKQSNISFLRNQIEGKSNQENLLNSTETDRKTKTALIQNKKHLNTIEVTESKQENNYEELILKKNANSQILKMNSLDDKTFENNSKIEILEIEKSDSNEIRNGSIFLESNAIKSAATVFTTDTKPETEADPSYNLNIPESSTAKSKQKIGLKKSIQVQSSESSLVSNYSSNSKNASINKEMFNSSIDTIKDFDANREEKVDESDQNNNINKIENDEHSSKVEENETRKNSRTSVESGEKLKIQSVVEAVGFLLFPSTGFTNLAFKQLLIEIHLFQSFKNTFKTEYKNMFSDEEKITTNLRYASLSEELLNKFINHLIKINKLDEKQYNLKCIQKRLGYLYFKNIFSEFERPLRSIGGTMQNFYSNLNSLHDALINHKEFGPRFLYLHEKYTGYSPSFRCEVEKIKNDPDLTETIFLNIFTIQERTTSFINNFYQGLIEASGKLLWNLDVRVEKIRNFDKIIKYEETSDKNDTLNLNELKTSPYIMGYRVKKLSKNVCDLSNSNSNTRIDNFIAGDDLSDDPNDLLLSVELFKSTYPFTIMIDRSLTIKQVGDGLVRHLGQLMQNEHGSNFLTYFSVEAPILNEITFESMLINHNMNYKLKMKTLEGQKSNQFKDMELKGSFLYMKECFCLLFIGSPVIHNLEEMTTRGLYISDIPIHDSTRDIILVGEQTKAQEGLKFRMEKLKKSIVKTHEEIDEEKEKNIELLNMIFPSDIAKKLWGGEKVPARSVYNVTLLYSDIVGFTSICSTAQPIEIIEMLKRLYTDFDNYCGLLDIYKIETIGDAYIVAGGLHKPSIYHSQQIAWMSLLMMDSASKNITNKGDTIKMRIGIHTGDVLAGIVGFKQPRYCLFGNNCSVANKFESMSEEKRIHVSPISKRLLEKTEGFEFEPRSAENLPENWAPPGHDLKNEISWFLNSYRHKDCKENDGILVNVQTALKDSIEYF